MMRSFFRRAGVALVPAPVPALVPALVLALSMAASLAQAQAPSSADVARYFRAVQMDDAATVRALLATVNPNELNPVGGEPGLVLAMREGSMKVFAVLLDQPGISLETPALNGNTALMMAAYKHNGAAVDTLLARGAIVSRSGWTALHYAASVGDDAIVRQLLAHGAQIDARSPPASGSFTPLMMAVREGRDDTVDLLLAAGASVAVRNGEGLTAVQIADRAEKRTIAAALRAYSAAHPDGPTPAR